MRSFVPVRGARKTSLQKRLMAGLRRQRKRLGWSQERAAEALGIVPRHYQKIEAGELNVTLRTLDRLCRAFSVDVDQLFEK